nr:peptidoglycan-associated lipoprotein Pal [Xanthomonadales bacterium]
MNFDFDKADVSGQFDEMIGCHAKWLQNNPGARLTLEGNADERGTREYNLGLGERRGNAVRDMLLAKGARSEQLTVVSYGEERPVCVESTDDCWARNRRADLVYT